MDNLTARATAAEVLKSQGSFLISPNIREYALSETDQSCRESMIIEYLQSKMDSKKVVDGGYKSRLDQARDTIIQLNNQIVIALLNGELEDSDYIRNRSEKMAALIDQAEQLEILAKTKAIAA